MSAPASRNWVFALTLLAAACGDDKPAAPSPFEAKEHVQIWATTASALAVYANVHQDIAAFLGEEAFPDATCPSIRDEGATWTATGGCTDIDEKEWDGKLTITRDGEDFTLSYDSFDDQDGTFAVRQLAPELHQFDAQLVIGGFTTIDYLGSVQGRNNGRTVWSGEGTVERDGFLPPNGAVEAVTEAEVVDSAVCAGQPASGSTTLTAGKHVAVITYDGATDCDEKQRAKLTVNDEPKGLLEGVTCAVSSVGSKSASQWLAGLCTLALALVTTARRTSCRGHRTQRHPDCRPRLRTSHPAHREG